MFTGLIEEVGLLARRRALARGFEFSLSARQVLEGMALGDSVAINGVCQTVTALEPGGFRVQAVGDTLEKTTLGFLRPGDRVNLERACTPATRLGGHMVAGHVNARGRIRTWQTAGEAWRLEVSLPDDLRGYVVAEGSIAVDGISLTVAALIPGGFRVNVIPHTRSVTTLKDRRAGDLVNLEVDMTAKVLEGLLKTRGPQESRSFEERLHAWGYV